MSESILFELGSEILVKNKTKIKFKARGSSMRPFIRDGDVVEIEPVQNDEICVGDVLLFKSGLNSLCLHRVISVKNGKFVLKGDSNRYIDGKIDNNKIIGKLTSVERNGQTIRMITDSFTARIISFSWISYYSYNAFIKVVKLVALPLYELFISIQPVRKSIKKYYKKRIETRFARQDDAFDISRFYGWLEHGETIETREKLKDKNSYYIISRLNGRLIGYVSLHFDENEPDPWNGWWLTGFFVRARFRGMGAATSMLNLAIEKVKESKGARIKLLAFEKRKPALNLYRKFGFERVIDPAMETILEKEAREGKTARRIFMVKEL